MSQAEGQVILGAGADPNDVMPHFSPAEIQALPTILRYPVPTNNAAEAKYGGTFIPPVYDHSRFQRWRYWMKTPKGVPVGDTLSDLFDAHARAYDRTGNWAKVTGSADANLYNCTAYALGTWNESNRTGNIIDIKEAVRRVLNDPDLAEEIMPPVKLFGNNNNPNPSIEMLRKAPEDNDILIFWENDIAAGGIRRCCHAAKLLNPQCRNGDFHQGLDLPNIMLSTKIGQNFPAPMSLLAMKDVPDYQNKTHAIYCLAAPTKIWKVQNCDCQSCTDWFDG